MRASSPEIMSGTPRIHSTLKVDNMDGEIQIATNRKFYSPMYAPSLKNLIYCRGEGLDCESRYCNDCIVGVKTALRMKNIRIAVFMHVTYHVSTNHMTRTT